MQQQCTKCILGVGGGGWFMMIIFDGSVGWLVGGWLVGGTWWGVQGLGVGLLIWCVNLEGAIW